MIVWAIKILSTTPRISSANIIITNSDPGIACKNAGSTCLSGFNILCIKPYKKLMKNIVAAIGITVKSPLKKNDFKRLKVFFISSNTATISLSHTIHLKALADAAPIHTLLVLLFLLSTLLSLPAKDFPYRNIEPKCAPLIRRPHILE